MPRRHLTQLGLARDSRRPPPADASKAHGYPRPLLRRAEWTNLSGAWDFALDPEAAWVSPGEAHFGARIEVPFAPETRASGIGDTGLYRSCWYRRGIELPPVERGERVILHFGAVDYAATVWFDGAVVGRHHGGYTPFAIDLAPYLHAGSAHELVVRAEDDPFDLTKPRGKQDWQVEPHSIWYPRTTGIWQPVWLERLGRAHVAELDFTPHLARWEIALDAVVAAPPGERFWLAVKLRVGEVLLADDRYTVFAGEVHRRVALSDPGIDDFRNELLWSPETPTIIEAEIELLDEAGKCVDRIASYTALRSFAIEGDRFVLNGRPYPLRLVLDQGYWPETGMTAPDDDALKRDVVLAKAMGFNGARKHQKVEDPRYLGWADRLGLLVWAEMPSAYRFTATSVARLTREWMQVIRRDASHPCIMAWVPFNESWGVPNLPQSKPERHYVEALYHLTRTLDPTRPVIGNDGWESVATDILGIHDYDDKPERIAARYARDVAPKLLERERPGGRVLVLEGEAAKLPIVLSEFGGITYSPDEAHTWGYSRTSTVEALAARYARLLAAVRSSETLAGFCYTQFTDTYQEANGLLYADRTPKFPLEAIRAATTGVAAGSASDVPAHALEIDGPVNERHGAP